MVHWEREGPFLTQDHIEYAQDNFGDGIGGYIPVGSVTDPLYPGEILDCDRILAWIFSMNGTCQFLQDGLVEEFRRRTTNVSDRRSILERMQRIIVTTRSPASHLLNIPAERIMGTAVSTSQPSRETLPANIDPSLLTSSKGKERATDQDPASFTANRILTPFQPNQGWALACMCQLHGQYLAHVWHGPLSPASNTFHGLVMKCPECGPNETDAMPIQTSYGIWSVANNTATSNSTSNPHGSNMQLPNSPVSDYQGIVMGSGGLPYPVPRDPGRNPFNISQTQPFYASNLLPTENQPREDPQPEEGSSSSQKPTRTRNSPRIKFPNYETIRLILGIGEYIGHPSYLLPRDIVMLHERPDMSTEEGRNDAIRVRTNFNSHVVNSMKNWIQVWKESGKTPKVHTQARLALEADLRQRRQNIGLPEEWNTSDMPAHTPEALWAMYCAFGMEHNARVEMRPLQLTPSISTLYGGAMVDSMYWDGLQAPAPVAGLNGGMTYSNSSALVNPAKPKGPPIVVQPSYFARRVRMITNEEKDEVASSPRTDPRARTRGASAKLAAGIGISEN